MSRQYLCLDSSKGHAVAEAEAMLMQLHFSNILKGPRLSGGPRPMIYFFKRGWLLYPLKDALIFRFDTGFGSANIGRSTILLDFKNKIIYIFKIVIKRFLEAPGIDPGTSRMLSERSTIWATPPLMQVAGQQQGMIVQQEFWRSFPYCYVYKWSLFLQRCGMWLVRFSVLRDLKNWHA